MLSRLDPLMYHAMQRIRSDHKKTPFLRDVNVIVYNKATVQGQLKDESILWHMIEDQPACARRSIYAAKFFSKYGNSFFFNALRVAISPFSKSPACHADLLNSS